MGEIYNYVIYNSELISICYINKRCNNAINVHPSSIELTKKKIQKLTENMNYIAKSYSWCRRGEIKLSV